MKMFNPTTMWFSKSVQKLENEQAEQEQIPQLTEEDILKTIDIAPSTESTNKENTSEMGKELDENNLILNKINVVVDAVKSALGLTDEVVTEETAEIGEDAQEEKPASEETEVVEGQEQDDEQPKNDSEENEPSEEETVEAGEEEKPEEQEEGQEEPAEEGQPAEEVEEQQEEQPEDEQEQEELEGEQEDVVESTEVAEIKVETDEIEEDEKGKLLQEIENLKAEKQEQEIKLQKMALSKEVEKDFGGVPGKLEDKVEMVFEIKNSALSDETKETILASLKQLSISNLKDCTEIGHDQEVIVDENAEKKAKIEQAMKEHGLTENQAFLYVNGERSLAEAKKFSNKVRNRK